MNPQVDSLIPCVKGLQQPRGLSLALDDSFGEPKIQIQGRDDCSRFAFNIPVPRAGLKAEYRDPGS